MSLALLFLALAIALVVGAALLSLRVLLRRGRGLGEILLAAFLIVLAIAVWYVGIRTPLVP